MTLRIAGVVGLFCLIGAASAQNFTAEDDGRQITISDRGQAVLTYVYASATPEGPSNYIHPLIGLYGETITGDSPSNWSGAPGIQWGWSKIGTDAGVADLSTGEGGRRIFERIVSTQEADNGMEVLLQSVWVVGADEHAQVIETMLLTVGPVIQGQRTIDQQLLVRSVSTGVIYLEGSIPGSGLSMTLNPERPDWEFSGAGIGLNPGPTLALSPWLVCSYRDDRRSSRSGVAILQDSRNPGFSQPNWLIESTQRVVGGVSPTVKTELKPGEFLQFRYRLILHHLSGSKMEMTGAYSQFMAEGQQAR